MIFSTPPFLVFFAILFAIVAVARSEQQRRLSIFVASLVFYGYWDWRFCPFLLLASTIDYHLALAIRRTTTAKRRWLALSVCSNLGLLAIFKYSGWLVENLNQVTGLELPVPDLPLPLGISFFTFQAMSYTIDVYRGSFDPTHRWFDFTFSMSFFPHLIAGPIVRASHFMPQLAHEHPLRRTSVREGAERFCKGFLKKTLLADQLAVCADTVFADPTFYSSATCWLAVISYTLQIYYDFSGYSDMAIGLARIFGFEFPENFDHPYLSRNITEFWRRWHLSLSSWLRDYLYISLGGNRRGNARTYVNLMLTMLLGGLWHGASWTFVAWGGLHGAALALHKWTSTRWPTPGTVRRAISLPLTLVFVMVCWVFFRATSFSDAIAILRKLVWIESAGCDWPYVPAVLASLAAFGAHLWIGLGRELRFDFRRPIYISVLLWALAIDLIYSPTVHSPFIYFQF